MGNFIKYFIYAVIAIAIFTTALYLGYTGLLGDTIVDIRENFIEYIPIELRVALFSIILFLSFGLINRFF